MKQIFDCINAELVLKRAKYVSDEIRDRENGLDLSADRTQLRRFGVEDAIKIVAEAEAKWEADCCIWEGFDNSLTKGKIEWTYKITCQSQPRYIPEEYTDSLWTRCPYCGKRIFVKED